MNKSDKGNLVTALIYIGITILFVAAFIFVINLAKIM